MVSTQQHVLPSVRRRPVSFFVLGEPSKESRRLRVGVVVASVVVMLVVGFWGLDRGSMWLDEAATFTMATRPVRQILAVLGNIDAVHGAYYLFQHFWLRLGGGEVWMRVPSVLAMGVAAGATAALGMRLAGARTGLVAGLLFAGWPLVSYYAQEGRSYALVTAAVLVATYCLVQALSARRRRWWWGYALSIVVAATLHEFAVLAVLAHGVVVLLARPGWRVWRWWLASVLACAVLMAPVAVLSLQQSNQVSHTKPPTWSTLDFLAEKFFGSSPWLPAFVVGLVVLGTVAEVRRWRRHEGGGLVAVALPLLLVPVVVLLTVSPWCTRCSRSATSSSPSPGSRCSPPEGSSSSPPWGPERPAGSRPGGRSPAFWSPQCPLPSCPTCATSGRWSRAPKTSSAPPLSSVLMLSPVTPSSSSG
jgi:mannosyltransferase